MVNPEENLFRRDPEQRLRREEEDALGEQSFSDRVAGRPRTEIDLLRDAQTERIAVALLGEYNSALSISEEAAKQAVAGTDIEPEVVVALAIIMEEEGEQERAA